VIKFGLGVGPFEAFCSVVRGRFRPQERLTAAGGRRVD
jgi:hypothetical protein